MILLKLKPVLEFERNVRYIYVLKRIYLYILYNRRHLTNQWLISLGCATLELAQFSTLLIFIYLSLVSMINLPPPIWLPPSFIAFTSHLSLPHVVPSGPLPLTFISLSALSDPNSSHGKLKYKPSRYTPFTNDKLKYKPSRYTFVIYMKRRLF